MGPVVVAGMNSPGQQLSEIFERLRLVENAVNQHVAECGIRNENRAQWERRMDVVVEKCVDGIESLNVSRAQLVGYIAGAAAVGALTGGAMFQGLLKLFHG